MTLRQALASTLHLFVVLFFFGAGFFCVSLASVIELRVQIIHLLLSKPELCTLFGIGFFSVSFLLLLGFYGLNRGQFLRILMGRHVAEIEAKIVRSTVEECFKKQFSQLTLQELEIVWKDRLEIHVSLGKEGNEEEILQKVEQELTALFKHRFGYKKPFTFIVRSL